MTECKIFGDVTTYSRDVKRHLTG